MPTVTAQQQTRTTQPVFQINEESLKSLIEDFFLILTNTEKTVIMRRFSLDNRPRQTLETIGKHFDVTRERIRQIENNALKKLQRNMMNSHIRKVSEVARTVLQENGGIMLKDTLLSRILKALNTETAYSGHVVTFALKLDPEIRETKRDPYFSPFYSFKHLKVSEFHDTFKIIRKNLQKRKEVTSFAAIYQDVREEVTHSKLTMEGVARSTPKILEIETGYIGLSKWRHINPKSIKDKAILIFKRKKEPMHFIDLANEISQFGDMKKNVTVQAVHNDLIRYPDFVLVGRGMYALTEWGIPAGTVMDIIAKVLKEKGPLKRQEIIQEVKKYRNVKDNTISLNLQKSKAFIRVGRAVYDFDEAKWEEPTGGRGRAYLKNDEEEE